MISEEEKERFQFLPAEQYLQLPREPQPWVIENLIPISGLVNIFGKPKLGKSFLCMGMAQAIANGESEWEGYRICKNGPVAYLQADTPREEWARRVERLEWREGYFWLADMWMVPEFPFNILNPQQIEIKWLQEQLKRFNPVVTFIDTLREVHMGDEDKSTIMQNVLALLVAACRPSAIVLISHARKDSIMSHQGDDLMDSGRGSSYVSGRMDIVGKLTAKRFTYHGRAGRGVEEVEQDQETGLIHIVRDDGVTDELLGQLHQRHAGATVNFIAEQAAKTLQVSVRTATRKVNKWREKKGYTDGK